MAPQTLREFLVLALRQNAEIAAAAETAAARLERIPQVTALPDPMLTTRTLPEPAALADGDNFFILGVSQDLPFPGKLVQAGRVALEETRMALQTLQETRLRVMADVKRAYFELYVLDKSLQLTGEHQTLLSGLIDVAHAQVASGRRSQDDVLRAHVELSDLEAELIDLRQRRVAVQAELNELLNRPSSTPIPTPADFNLQRTDLSVETLFTKAGERNPALRRLEHQIERDRQSLAAAQLAYWPDFNIGFEWMEMEPREAFRPAPDPTTGMRPEVDRMSEKGRDGWAIMFGFTLPIWFDKIEAGVREARRMLAASQHEHTAARNRVHREIAAAYARVQADQELAALFKDTIIPQAEQTYQVSQASYATGTSDFLDVIDNWRKWLAFSIQYYRSLGDLERSVADLEQAIGLGLSELGKEDESTHP